MKRLTRLYSTVNDIVFQSNGVSRTITLNRPQKLNAITQEMCESIAPRLQEYAKSDLVGTVILKGAGSNFCSGGDVKKIALRSFENGLEKSITENAKYFRTEFSLNHLIGTYTKPFVSILNGFVMGGGVGLSAHGSFRVGTESVKIGMPETKIGYFPDVGGLFFLSKLNGKLGAYLALTSQTIDGYNAYRLGLLTHYVNSETIPKLERRLSELEANAVSLDHYFDLVDQSISEFAGEPEINFKPQFSSSDLEIIDESFGLKSLEEIIAKLQQLESKSPEFVQQTLKHLSERCPLSLKVTLRAYQNVQKMDFKAALEQDMVLSHNFCLNENFNEGVRALLVDKRAPKFTPSEISEVSDQQVSSFFSKPSDFKPIEFTSDLTFTEYPHSYGLPSEQQVMDFVTGETSLSETKATRADVLEFFRKKYPLGYKQGLEEYLNELLDRRTTVDKEDAELLDWKY